MEAYLNGELDDKAMHQVERLLLKSPFEEEAMEGLAELPKAEREEDIAALKSALKSRTSAKNQSYTWWYAAASIILIGTVSYFLIQRNTDMPGQDIVMAEQELSEDPASGAENKSSVLDSSDLIAMNEGASQENRDVTEPQSEEPDAALNRQPAETSGTIDQNTESRENTQILSEASIAEAEALDVEPDALSEPARVEMKPPSEERSKVGRISGESLAITKNGGRTVHGRVIMQDGTPLPGVNVAISGTERGTISDIDGYYEIDVPDDATLVFSLLGLEAMEITHPDGEELNITMQQDDAVLSERVVTAPAQRDSASITGAEPISGKEAYKRYLQDNLKYPASDLEGTVVIQVSVGPDGGITALEVTRSLAPEFDQEALRLIREGPIWVPALKNGNPAADRVLVEVEFQKD